jgi:hypothetical protein
MTAAEIKSPDGSGTAKNMPTNTDFSTSVYRSASVHSTDRHKKFISCCVFAKRLLDLYVMFEGRDQAIVYQSMTRRCKQRDN